MKKIKILNAFIIFMILFHIFSFVTNMYLNEVSEYGETLKTAYDRVVFGQLTPYIHITLSLFTFIGLVYVQRALSNCINEGFFNIASVSQFRHAALFLFLSGGFGFIFDAILVWKAEGDMLFGNLGVDFFMLIIAFSLYIIADVIENGSFMRQDSELTI